MGSERKLAKAVKIAKEVKQAIHRDVGEYQRCSIGLAPNRFLAKTASDLEKPDGLVSIQRGQLPDLLYSLALCDLSGIGPRIERRLHQSGVRTVASNRWPGFGAEWWARVFGTSCAAMTLMRMCWRTTPAWDISMCFLRSCEHANWPPQWARNCCIKLHFVCAN